MKNVLQLTFHAALSYGAIIQTYSLGIILHRMGYSVQVLNFTPAWMSPIWPGNNPSTWIMRAKFSWFAKKNLQPKIRCFRGPSGFDQACKHSHAVVVGSDQVWNPEITRDVADVYFLKYVPASVRRIAYAASFGVSASEWAKRFDDGHYSSLLRAFHQISVRETDAVELCTAISPGVTAQAVLDPSLLLTADDYRKQLHLGNKRYGIVSFRFRLGVAHYSLLDALKQTINENVLLLCSRKKPKFNHIFLPSPKTWVEAIAGASFVVTDSFHVVCFAIIFNKQFIALPANPNRINRLTSILEQLGIGNRLFPSENEAISRLSTLENIDYAKVNSRLSVLRDISLSFLSNSLS